MSAPRTKRTLISAGQSTPKKDPITRFRSNQMDDPNTTSNLPSTSNLDPNSSSISARRSPRLSTTNYRVPTPPRMNKKLIIALDDSFASSVFLSNRNEFSDDEEPVNSSTRDVTGTTQNVIGTSQNVTGTSQNAEFVERLKENATKVWKNVATRSRDLYNSARFNLWECRSENGRRSLVAVILLLLIFPFALPHYKHYATIVSDQTRIIFLSVPDMLSGSSSTFVRIPGFGFPETPKTRIDANQKVDIENIVQMLISNPMFIDMIKSEQSKRSQHSKQMSENEIRISSLLKKFQSEMDSKNSHLSSEIESLKWEVEGKLEKVAQKIPNLGSQLDVVSASAIETSRALDSKLAGLDLELESTRREMEHLKTTKSRANEMSAMTLQKISGLEQKLSELNQEYKELTVTIKNCQSKYLTVEDQVEALFHELLSHRNGSVGNAKIETLIKEITSNFVTDAAMKDRMEKWSENLRQEFEQEVQVMVTEKIRENFREKVETFEDAVYQRVSEDLTKVKPAFSKEEIARIVQDALMTYDADKTGLFDFALESAGGTIASTRCTETYDLSNAVYSVWGVPIWWIRNSPRTILQPGSSPGQCWAFRGSQGSVVINLSSAIYVRAVTLEHIPATLAPDGSISSAPKSFEVFGLASLNDENPVSLGNFTYNDQGSPVQTFYLTREPETSFNMVELKVLSNYGNMAYTCIYRFRIHGNISSENS